MALPMRPNSSRGGSVSRNRRVKGDCTFRCTGCLPTHLGWIRSKSGGVGCSANICSLITFPARMPSKPLSERISPITIKRPSRSTGPTPSRSLNRKSVRIYDSVYLEYNLVRGLHPDNVLVCPEAVQHLVVIIYPLRSCEYGFLIVIRCMGIFDQRHIITHSSRPANSGVYTVFRLSSHNHQMLDPACRQFSLQ